jgi:hypothetical protein
VGKLYLSSKGNYFACRKCHDLRYKSSQRGRKLNHWPL